jgi:CubicO group peptidase (beta-lactamase class C family)
MRTFKEQFFLIAVMSICLLGISCDTASREDFAPVLSRNLAAATPEEVGMSTERLSRLSRAMQELVDQGRLPGIVTMLARHGKIAHFETFGYQEISSSVPMAKDSIFRIYSMSKPITGVAMMMLYEEGEFRLSDPVAKYIPEFKDLKVAAGVGKNGPIVEDADHLMTIRELMSHTAGLTYGVFSKSQVDDMYVKAGVLDPDSTLKDMILKLSKIPLRQQPGSLWHYSVAVDVQGYLVEVLSGQRFDVFLKERLFDPLGMVDTGFHVPQDKAGRFAQVYNYDKDNNLIAMDGGGNNYLKPPTFFSGGGGLVSTAMDYMRFCQMLLNGGILDDVRILSPLTVDLMHRNQLPKEVAEIIPGSGVGFGLDFAVVLNPVEAFCISEGEYFWGGLAGTWFWIDPVEDLIFVGMIQQMGQNRPDVRSLSRQLVYQAILEPANSK